MEPGEWLPLAITGAVGLAGIAATLWGNLSNLAAQKRRDIDAATERRETAEREAEAARRVHLLEERRDAYLQLTVAASEWIDVMNHRAGLSLGAAVLTAPEGLAADSAGEGFRTRVARCVATTRLVGPVEVNDAAQDMLHVLNGVDANARRYRAVVSDDVERVQIRFDRLVVTMKTDLMDAL
ncbi:hypothetical protein [Cellulosimicrobium sp. Marseille-Q4280]|uniref:hypothetical protein n=1 Tax=Cellulosimicrobium sp. Marseille-Q4280 TaxID=2937992 RepID=UPI00203A636C|nr:hypothetical protein [Cellulosimicrobium sp. Marseille-Q4280]